MKIILASALLFSALSAIAGSSVLESVPDEVCKNIKIDYNKEIATCTAKDSKRILAAKVGATLTSEEYAMLDFSPLGPIELGVIPDADTSSIYSYTKYLNDKNGATVGILTIDGYVNSEIEMKGRVDTRYNLKGEVVSIELK